MIVLLLLLIPIVALLVWYLRVQSNRRARVKLAYGAAKDALRRNPSDSFLREAVLECGRKYYGSLRDGGLPTIYDESAIMNDMNAIIGSSPR